MFVNCLSVFKIPDRFSSFDVYYAILEEEEYGEKAYQFDIFRYCIQVITGLVGQREKGSL